MNGNGEINERTRFAFTTPQLIGFVILLSTTVAGWVGTIATLQSNRTLLLATREQAETTRAHQIKNEYIIDDHSLAINELRKEAGLPPIMFRSAVGTEYRGEK